MQSWLINHYDAVIAANWSPIQRYGIAAAAIACAFGLTQFMPEAARTPFLFYIPAVIVSSIYGDLGAGLLAAALALVLAPVWSVAAADPENITNTFPLHTGSFGLVAGAVIVLASALRQARCRLRDERRRLGAQLEHQALLLGEVNDAVCIVGLDLDILYWNRAAAELYGWPAGQALGKNVALVIGTAAAPKQRPAQLARIASGGQQRLEELHYDRTGRPIPVEISVSVRHDEGGAPAGYILINRDISARKRVEQELVELTRSLEQRVAARTAELQRSNRELDQFAYIASHDLKAPLRAIGLLASWIAEDAGAVLPQKSKEHLAKLHARVERMENLLDDLLAYSRAGRLRQTPERVDTRALVEDAVEFLNLPPGLRVEMPQAMPVLYTERVPLATVLRNLIHNAYKHHHQPASGTVTITVAGNGAGHGTGSAAGTAARSGELVSFTVADDGPGIAPEHHDAVFDLFRTLRPRDELEGSGLGLSVVKKTVESRGGTITLASALGEGAAFTFTWPQQQ